MSTENDPEFFAQTISEILAARLESPLPGEWLSENLKPQLIVELIDERTPPAGIFGVGVVGNSAAVFVTLSLVGEPNATTVSRPRTLAETPAAPIVQYYLDNAGRYGLLKELLAIGLPLPTEQATVTTGEQLTCGPYRGICGLPVYFEGRPAMLTAGHVTRSVDDQVRVAGRTVGRVAFTDHLSLHPQTHFGADIGIVELMDDVAWGGPDLLFKPISPAPLSRVTSAVGNMPRGETLTPKGDFSLRQGVGGWAQTYIVVPAISVDGHSGAPVFLGEPTLSSVVGHVVGGSSGFSLVQDLQFLLDVTGASLLR